MKISRIISCLTTAGMVASVMPQLITADAVSTPAGIRINEVCTQNKACLTDSYGESSDWIEIYNPTEKPVSLAGYSISKNPAKPKSWVFPDDAVIGAGEYLVIIASKNKSVSGEYHTGFNLSKNGETLTLKSPDGSVVHELSVPTLGEDFTYGITYTGNAEIMEATPGKSNKITVSAPGFSRLSGFYPESFSLSLSASNGETIYYTTDGSDPVNSETARVYKDSITVKDRSAESNIYRAYGEKEGDPLSICYGNNYIPPSVPVDKAMVVRAVAKNADGVYSDVVQQTYFITDGNLAEYSDTTIVSLVTDPDNLFDADKGIYVIGNKWNWDTYEWDVDYDPDNMRNFHGRGKEWEREANITVFDNGENIIEQNIGIRIKGSSTRNAIDKSFNLFARSEYGASKINYPLFRNNTDVNGNLITEYDSISLRSATGDTGVNINDTICHELMKDRDNTTMTAKRPCVLFINGEYWGLYELTEKFSDDFIKQHYGTSKSNVAMIKNDSLEEGEDSDIDEFFNLIATYSALDLSDDDNYKEACEYFDVDSLIEEFASGIYYGKWDWPLSNYGAWKDKTAGADNRWHFMSYDFDFTLGSTYDDVDQKLYSYNFFEDINDTYNEATVYNPLDIFISMLDNKEFKLKFARAFKEYADKDSLSIGKSIAEARIHEFAKTFYFKRLHIYDDGWQVKEDAVREDIFDTTYEFLEKRPEYALSQMYEYLDIEPGELTDGIKYEIADFVKLSKYLLGTGKLNDWKKYDLCNDNHIDSYDMCLLREKVIEDTNLMTNLVDFDTMSAEVLAEGAYAEFMKTDEDGFIAYVAESGSEPWNIQVKYQGMNIEKNSVYRVSFDYTADKKIPFTANVMMPDGDFTIYDSIDITADKQSRHYSGEFTMTEKTDNTARLSFDLGAVDDVPFTLTVSNIRLEKIR